MRRWALVVPALLAFAGADLSGQTPDTTTYANRATADLVALARARHLRQDSLVRDYRAVITTRMDASAGRSRFARMLPLIAHETVARVTWRRPNDLKLDVLGVRARSIFRGVKPEVAYNRPWFVPRALSDSITLMGVPETAALHPLAPGAADIYRYAITDSVIISLPGRTIRAIKIRVQPKTLGPSVVAGDMWVDAESADVVRLMVTFLGEYLWDVPEEGATAEDSADVRNDNKWAQRFVTVQADLEYSLLENRYWMPFRQLLAITVEVNFLVRGALPVRALTTFSDYEVNVDPVFAFTVAGDSLEEKTREEIHCGDALDDGPVCPEDVGRDQRRDLFGYARSGLWSGGRWEVSIPPQDSLATYAWRDSLDFEMDEGAAERIRQAIADLETMIEDLPPEWVARQRYGLAWDKLADIARFNRVQGPSFGLGYEVRPGPRFTTLRGSARFGISDRRFTGSLTWRRDGPGGALEIKAYRSIFEVEPWSAGQSLGNSLNAAFAGHDDADYFLSHGGELSYYPYTGPLRDTRFAVAFERHDAIRTRAGSSLNEALGGPGVFQLNPTVIEGEFVRASIRPSWRTGRTRISAGVDGMAGDGLAGGRGWAAARVPFSIMGRTGALSLRGGHTVGDSLPQLRFRVGGPATVRGYDYGVLRGEGFWSAQLDVALTQAWALAPVAFIDVGDTFAFDERFDASDALVGVGVGASLLNGWLRFNLAKPLNPSGSVRFDLLFGAPR